MQTTNLRVLLVGLMAPFILASCSALNVKTGDDNATLDSPDAVLNLLDPEVKSEQDALAKAQTALQEGKADNALFYYVKALQYNKNNVMALESIAAIHEQEKHPDLAIKVYQNILALDSKHALANEKLGLYYLDQGQDGKAKQFLSQAVLTDKSRWRSYNGLGVIADLEGNTADAIAHYQAALAVSPSNPMLLNNLGYSYYLSGDTATARNLFSQALNIDTQYKRAIHNLALIEIKNGQFTSAVSLFNRIMSAEETYNNIGYIAMLNGQYEVAEEYLIRAIDENPVYFPKAQENLKNLLDLKRAGSVARAESVQIQDIEDVSETQPTLDEDEETADEEEPTAAKAPKMSAKRNASNKPPISVASAKLKAAVSQAINPAKPAAESASVSPPIAKGNAQPAQPHVIPVPEPQAFVKKSPPLPKLPVTPTASTPLDPLKKTVFVTEIGMGK